MRTMDGSSNARDVSAALGFTEGTYVDPES